MKKKTLLIIACLLIALPCFAEDQKPIDLVVVMDSSSSMSGSYRDVTEYAIGPMLRDFLRIGDTFHILSFSDRPRMELSRRIEGIADVETIIGRMLLLYPLVPYSDVISALEYLSAYLGELPETRQKTVLFISDGEHLPPAGSPHASIGKDKALDRLNAAASALKGNGWTFHFIRTPFQGSTRPVPLIPRPLPSSSGDGRSGTSGIAKGGTATAGTAEPGYAQADVPAESGNSPAGNTGTAKSRTEPTPAPSQARPIQSSPAQPSPAPSLAAQGQSSQAQTSRTQSPLTQAPLAQAPLAQAPETSPAASGKPAAKGAESLIPAPDGPSATTEAVDISDALSQMLSAPIVDIAADGIEAVAAALGSLSAEFPADLGSSARSLIIPLSLKNPSSSPVHLEAVGLLVDGTDRISRKAFITIPPRGSKILKIRALLPEDFPSGQSVLHVQPLFSGGIRITPPAADIGVNIGDAPVREILSLLAPWVAIAFGVAAALALAAFLINYLRGMHAGPGRAVAVAAEREIQVQPKTVPAQSGSKSARSSPIPSSAPPQPSPSPSSIPDKGGNLRGDADLLALFAQRTKPEAGATITRSGPAAAAAVPAAAVPAPASSVQLQAAGPSRAVPGSPIPLADRSKELRSDADLLSSFAARTKADGKAVLPSAAGAPASARGTSLMRPDRQTLPPDPKTAKQQFQPAKRELVSDRMAPLVIRKPDERIMLSLHVEDQNTMIGRRNIHLLKAGSGASLGGANSDFLIFLVPFPRRIAELRFDGEKCMLIPRLRSFFPDSGDKAIEDCVGKTIRIVSGKGYELKIRFDRYEDPLASLNRFLHSIDIPGRMI